MKADYQKFRKKFAFLQDHYFDIHGYKVRPEIFPGTEILAINNEHEAEDLWWTVEDYTADGRMIKAINAIASTPEAAAVVSSVSALVRSSVIRGVIWAKSVESGAEAMRTGATPPSSTEAVPRRTIDCTCSATWSAPLAPPAEFEMRVNARMVTGSPLNRMVR